MVSIDELLKNYRVEVKLSNFMFFTKGRIASDIFILNKVNIKIKKGLELKKRVLAFFHEVYRLDKEKDPYYCVVCDFDVPYDELKKREEDLDKAALETYNSRPELVERVIKEYKLDAD